MCAGLLGSFKSRSSCKRCCSTGVGACLFRTVGAGADDEGRGDRGAAVSDMIEMMCSRSNTGIGQILVSGARSRVAQPLSCGTASERHSTLSANKPNIMGSSDGWLLSAAIVWLFSVFFFLVLLIPVQGVVTRFRINYTPKGVGLGEHGDEQTLSQDMRVGPVVNSVRIPLATAAAAGAAVAVLSVIDPTFNPRLRMRRYGKCLYV